MFEFIHALVEDELDHDTGDESERDGRHKDKVICSSCFLDILELLINWVCHGRHIEVEIG